MIVVLAGPTASGKSEIATKLAKLFNGYIINADSRQVFKELNIGTAKPTEGERKSSGIKHELFGHISIDEDYNLFKYQNDVKEIIKQNKNKVAFLVGGTGLYIDSVVYNYELKESNTDLKLRESLEKLSITELQEKIGDDLKKLNKSDQNNPRRLIRFLERGQTFHNKGKPLKHIYLVLDRDFKTIEQNIKERIERMFEQGLVEENESLLKEGKHGKIDTIGYKEFREYFKGEIDINEVKERIFVNSKKYAKRQMTWFRKNKNALWVKDYEESLKICNRFLS